MPATFRFAPSPTGFLHLGHALSAAFVWRAAERAGGRVLLRIEDIDRARSRPEFVRAICEDLAWLGFAWEGEPVLQSTRLAAHRAALATLERRGLVYPCRLSRADVAAAASRLEQVPRDPDGAPRLPIAGAVPSDPDGPVALRLDMAAATAALGDARLTWREDGEGAPTTVEARPGDWGDVVLARKDAPTSYHLAVTVDDATDGVTHVVRGRDLFHATSVHRLLQTLLGLPAPIYAHHPLLTDEDGRKLAKSRRSEPLRGLRAAGWGPQDVFRAIAPFLSDGGMADRGR